MRVCVGVMDTLTGTGKNWLVSAVGWELENCVRSGSDVGVFGVTVDWEF